LFILSIRDIENLELSTSAVYIKIEFAGIGTFPNSTKLRMTIRDLIPGDRGFGLRKLEKNDHERNVNINPKGEEIDIGEPNTSILCSALLLCIFYFESFFPITHESNSLFYFSANFWSP
jgi:hypothetical protein